MRKRVTSLQGPSPRHCACATQLLSKCLSGGEPLATLRSVWSARGLNLKTIRFRDVSVTARPILSVIANLHHDATQLVQAQTRKYKPKPGPKTNIKPKSFPKKKKTKVKIGLKSFAMLLSYFDYIFVHLRQKARLRPKIFVNFSPEPDPTCNPDATYQGRSN